MLVHACICVLVRKSCGCCCVWNVMFTGCKHAYAISNFLYRYSRMKQCLWRVEKTMISPHVKKQQKTKNVALVVQYHREHGESQNRWTVHTRNRNGADTPMLRELRKLRKAFYSRKHSYTPALEFWCKELWLRLCVTSTEWMHVQYLLYVQIFTMFAARGKPSSWYLQHVNENDNKKLA